MKVLVHRWADGRYHVLLQRGSLDILPFDFAERRNALTVAGVLVQAIQAEGGEAELVEKVHRSGDRGGVMSDMCPMCRGLGGKTGLFGAAGVMPGACAVCDGTGKQPIPSSAEQIADIKHNPRLMDPGGGSLETTAAVRALFALCCAQQREIDELRDRLAALVEGVPYD